MSMTFIAIVGIILFFPTEESEDGLTYNYAQVVAMYCALAAAGLLQ